MAFNMGTATYARSASGKTSLKNNLNGDLDAIANILNTSYSNFSVLRSTIKENWQGVDCDAYIKSLERKVTSLKEDVLKYKACINTALDNDYNAFQKFQSTNSTTMSNLK